MNNFTIPHDGFDVKSRIVAEIDKDLTNHSVADIEHHLAGR
jgi:protein required for attachment to host cells